MQLLKPFIKTFIVSSVLFFILVFLGMKYHWVGFFQNKNNQNIELDIPQNTALSASDATPRLTGIEEFQPEIISAEESATLIVNMTKNQIKSHCIALYKNSSADEVLKEFAIGDCVISNYKEVIKEDTSQETSVFKSTNNRQIQINNKNITLACEQKVSQMVYSNDIERQLLQGVCVSGSTVK